MDKLAIELRKLKLKNKLSREPAETKYIQEAVIKETSPIGNIREQKRIYEPMDFDAPRPPIKSMELDKIKGPLPKDGELMKKLESMKYGGTGILSDDEELEGSEDSDDYEESDLMKATKLPSKYYESDLLKEINKPSKFSKGRLGDVIQEDNELKSIKADLLKYKLMNKQLEEEKKSLTPNLDRLYKGKK